jgi:aryl-alcohol dehydrogenase-like predicted oxidoreductase
MRPTTRSRFPHLTDRLPLGKSGLMVSPFCLGAVGEPSTIEAAFDAGINFFFFTGDLHWPMYGHSRRGLSALLQRRPSVRSEIVVAVCSYTCHPGFIGSSGLDFQQSVPELGHVDVLILGGVREVDFLPRLHQAERLRHAGAVRSIGATFHERQAGLTGFNRQLVDAAFIRYNAVHPGARRDLFPALDSASPSLLYNFKSVLGYLDDAHWDKLGLSGDHWRPSPTDYYRFILSQPQIDGILCAPSTPAEVTGLARALEQPLLTDEEQQYLIDLAELAAGKAQLQAPGSTGAFGSG